MDMIEMKVMVEKEMVEMLKEMIGVMVEIVTELEKVKAEVERLKVKMESEAEVVKEKEVVNVIEGSQCIR